jgi:hypothetical protein
MEQSRDEHREKSGGSEDVAVREVDQLDDPVHHRVSDGHERVDRAQDERILELLAREGEATLLVRGEYCRHDRAHDDRSEVLRDDVVAQPDNGSECVERPARLARPRCQTGLLDERGGCVLTGDARLS